MKNKNLLIISSGFPDKINTYYGGIFVKSQLKYLKNYFKQVFVIFPIPRTFGVCDFDKFCKDYEYDNVKVYFPRFWDAPISFFRKRRGDRWFKVIDKLIKKEKIKFDLIHSHFTYPSGYVGAKLKDKYKKPLVTTIHENRTWFLEEFNSKDQKLIYAWEKPDFLIRVNKIDLPLLKKYNKNSINIPNGFDKEKFYPLKKDDCRKRLNLPLDKKILFTLAFLVEKKGHKYAIQAISKIIKEKKDILYLIGGTGKLKNVLQTQINNLNLQNNIKLLGSIPDELINYYFNACDLFVLPSLSEGNPTVMFESIGSGLPFIGTKVGGISEIITSDDYGLLCEPANSKQLAENILIALDKKWDKDKILNYSKKFRWDKIAKEIVGCYKEVIK